jgi:hypothetical protein
MLDALVVGLSSVILCHSSLSGTRSMYKPRLLCDSYSAMLRRAAYNMLLVTAAVPANEQYCQNAAAGGVVVDAYCQSATAGGNASHAALPAP